MNIALDARTLLNQARTGVGEYAWEMFKAIITADRENQYFIFQNSHQVKFVLPDFAKQKNVRLLNYSYPNKLLNAGEFFLHRPYFDELIKRDSGQKIDWWFAPHLNFYSLSKSVRQILTVHDLSFEYFPEFFTARQRLWHQAVRARRSCAQATHIITPSQNTKNDLVEKYNLSEDKIKVIYPGRPATHLDDIIDTDKINQTKQKYGLPDEFILFLGTIEPRKNLKGLIGAFEKIGKNNSNLQLVIAGAPGWKNTPIYQQAAASPLSQKIKFIGRVDEETKQALYRLATIFVYPSFYEGFGFPVLEAMAAGLPVITSNRSSLPEVAGEAAILIDPINTNDIADKILQLNNNRELKNRLKEAGKKQATKFSWEQSAREWLALLN